jgi:aromatic ring-cleaving dioxygenase
MDTGVKMDHFHAHIYYDEKTIDKAKRLVKKAESLNYLEIGRMHEKPVGPHPLWSCQLLCLTKDINKLIPWLMVNREDLTIFIHPLSGNDLDDHSKHVMFLGEAVALNLDIFKGIKNTSA